MPKLATKTEQLFTELERLRFTRKIDGFTLKRLQKEAHSLLKVDALHAYQILGALESLAGNIAEMRENYEKGLRLASTESEKSIALHNYAASLSGTGFFSEAVELKIKSGNFSGLGVMLTELGAFHQVAQYLDKDERLDEKTSRMILSVAQFMDEQGVSDAELQQLIEIAISVLHAHQFFDFRNNTGIEFAGDEGARWFRYVIKVNRSVEEVVEMKYELACQLAEIDLSPKLLSNFITTYECVGE